LRQRAFVLSDITNFIRNILHALPRYDSPSKSNFELNRVWFRADRREFCFLSLPLSLSSPPSLFPFPLYVCLSLLLDNIGIPRFPRVFHRDFPRCSVIDPYCPFVRCLASRSNPQIILPAGTFPSSFVRC